MPYFGLQKKIPIILSTADSRRYAEERVVFPSFFKTGSCKEVPYRFVKKNGQEIDILLSAFAGMVERAKLAGAENI